MPQFFRLLLVGSNCSRGTVSWWAVFTARVSSRVVRERGGTSGLDEPVSASEVMPAGGAVR
ncbi:hypothetical protein [Streptomyces adelaidensis]|uniref:hypothetical protein n=1 Tax=Streptomyces adelaidensis TaxID=2796465 RepID=UPI001907817D|nr:hypothetical protein [Streptomyces adelaidensis]